MYIVQISLSSSSSSSSSVAATAAVLTIISFKFIFYPIVAYISTYIRTTFKYQPITAFGCALCVRTDTLCRVCIAQEKFEFRHREISSQSIPLMHISPFTIHILYVMYVVSAFYYYTLLTNTIQQHPPHNPPRTYIQLYTPYFTPYLALTLYSTLSSKQW